MARLDNILEYADQLLDINQFSDYCPNGLQVQGRSEVGRIVGGVTASKQLIDQAIAEQADAILVHHGYFWKGETPVITGMKYERIRSLIESGISLLAYHLPLDAHPVYGNNACLAELLGISVTGSFARNGKVDIALHGHLTKALSAAGMQDRIEQVLGRKPLHIAGSEREIYKVGWCTGAAQGYIEEAAALELDAYITGEISEHTYHTAKELGIHFFAAGHHATERYGVQALGAHLSDYFNLEFKFIDSDNPV